MKNHILVFLSFVCLSCAQNNSTDDQKAQPPLGVNTRNGPWTEIIREEGCSPARNAPLCVQGKFIVKNSAQFSFESDVYPAKTGELTREEFRQLNALTAKVDFASLDEEFTCAEVLTIPELNSNILSFRVPDNRVVTFYEFGERGQCYRLPAELTNDFNMMMRALTQKYSAVAATSDG